jgi:hypothetical protein
MRAVDTLVNRTREGTAALRGLSPTAPLAAWFDALFITMMQCAESRSVRQARSALSGRRGGQDAPHRVDTAPDEAGKAGKAQSRPHLVD